MQRHRPSLLTALPLLCALSLAAGLRAAKAQTAQPITSLPKPSDSYTTPQPAAQDNSVHPITSLPKPPAPTPEAVPTGTYTLPDAMLPAPVPVPQLPPASTSAVPPPALAQPVPLPEAEPLHVSTPLPPQPKVVAHKPIRPFSTLAAAINISTSGVGLDLATPLAQHFNLRVDGGFFTYNSTFNLDGETITGDIKLRNASASLDWFPFHGGFHLSPGLTVYNGNSVSATTMVPAGGEFDLGDQTYYSSATDPIHGSASLYLGKRVAPRFTIGFGNMIPRSGRHFSFPFEIGFEYISPPRLNLTLAGSACDTGTPPNCSPVATDPTTQANLQQEIDNVNSDLKPLGFYPIISQGFSVRF
jgi:hypothetical protein